MMNSCEEIFSFVISADSFSSERPLNFHPHNPWTS
uniref:Uncharacterized protein n=1 Tax=Manihot esculenta TaxID=3983 RepID=A0A199UA20_MANES